MISSLSFAMMFYSSAHIKTYYWQQWSDQVSGEVWYGTGGPGSCSLNTLVIGMSDRASHTAMFCLKSRLDPSTAMLHICSPSTLPQFALLRFSMHRRHVQPPPAADQHSLPSAHCGAAARTRGNTWTQCKHTFA